MSGSNPKLETRKKENSVTKFGIGNKNGKEMNQSLEMWRVNSNETHFKIANKAKSKTIQRNGQK